MWGFGILVVLVLLLLAAGPWFPYSRRWGYRGMILLGVLLIVWLLILWSGIVLFSWPGAAPPPVTAPPSVTTPSAPTVQ